MEQNKQPYLKSAITKELIQAGIPATRATQIIEAVESHAIAEAMQSIINSLQGVREARIAQTAILSNILTNHNDDK